MDFLNLVLINELNDVAERHNLNLERRLLRDTSNPFEIDDLIFIKYFRVSKNITGQVIETLQPVMDEKIRGTKIDLELKVLAVLNFLGNGSYQQCTELGNDVIGDIWDAVNIGMVKGESVIEGCNEEVFDDANKIGTSCGRVLSTVFAVVGTVVKF
uniref:Uncharacterized protein LOC114344798 n=1 Tax=Diabrotica virgifera virgifera TaxID=50390 RepID=A0A6P7GZ70_DIAVI